MIRLPQEFTARMRKQLGEEFPDFLAAYESEGYAGLRVNTQKISVEAFLALTPFSLERVPWTDNGFYYRKEEAVSKHPHYFAGLYYIQEPSAMLPAAALPVRRGDLVLDLCAAPGGKATELSSRLGGEGLLIANDISAGRAKALVKNLALWGSTNSCITGETPLRLLEAFGCCFDRILVDAPCSGEGMFRKDNALVSAWESRGPKEYAPVQKELLDQAVRMLRPGGVLAYSTCTFSEEENEDVAASVLTDHPELSPMEDCMRFWPHRVKGEGHFLALIKKEGGIGETPGLPCYTDDEIQASRRNMSGEVREFLSMLPARICENRIFRRIGEQCLLIPPYRLPEKLRYLRTGILAGHIRRDRFEPSQALAMLLGAQDFPSCVDLASEDERTVRYLKGETLELSAEEESGRKGWTLVCVDGFGLGWAKYAGASLKNKYYPGWRMV